MSSSPWHSSQPPLCWIEQARHEGPPVRAAVPRDAPDRLQRTAISYCARCDMNHQFNVGLDLIIRGLETECPGTVPGEPA